MAIKISLVVLCAVCFFGVNAVDVPASTAGTSAPTNETQSANATSLLSAVATLAKPNPSDQNQTTGVITSAQSQDSNSSQASSVPTANATLGGNAIISQDVDATTLKQGTNGSTQIALGQLEKSLPFKPDQKLEIVKQINSLRSTVAGGDLQTIVWDNSLAVIAQKWADKCTIDIRPAEERKQSKAHYYHGENNYILPAKVEDVNVTDVVTLWWNEKDGYTYGKYGDPATCQAGKACGHYTQLVWANTCSIGCGATLCNGGQVVVCDFFNPGNYMLAVPYTPGTPCSACGGNCTSSNLCPTGAECLANAALDVSP